MFKKLTDKLSDIKNFKNKSNTNKSVLSKAIADNIRLFKNIFSGDETVIYREFTASCFNGLKCVLIFVDEMVDKEIINENIIQPVLECKAYNSTINRTINQLNFLVSSVINAGSIKKTADIDQIIEAVLYGDTVLLLDGCQECLIIDTKGWQTRSITTPKTEEAVRGPREGFTESLVINLSLIRRRLLTPDFKVKFKVLGERTKTKVCICYLDDLAPKKIIKELEKRLDQICIDGVLETGYIQELIKDGRWSPFNTINSTERPDVVVSKLLEGRVAVICDGTPFVLTLPFVFIENFQANEDYYSNFTLASFNRLLRYLAFFLSISVPSIYIALVTYHQEMIPTPLLLSIATARQGVPFPTVIEAIAMLIAFDLLREAGVRLPTPIGQTVSIVGALILGEAAVTARLVSAPMIIIVALTGISSFLVVRMLGAVIIIRLILVFLAAMLGLYGYIFGIMGLFIHLLSLRSFGVPYMLEIPPASWQDAKDTVIRAPWWSMRLRPKLLTTNKVRKTERGK